MIYNIVSYVRVLWYKTMLYNIVKSYVLYQYNITLLSPMFYICFCMWCRRRVERGIEVKSRGDVKKLSATKTDDETERQLVQTLAHAIVFIVSICYL